MADGDDLSKPTPDPTVLTTEQLLREVQGLKVWVDAKLNGQADVIAERFSSVTTQFVLIERQRVEQKADTEKAVQAALNAAKEAVKEQTAASEKSITKSETATSEQLKQLSTTFTTSADGLRRDIDEGKERLSRIESSRQEVDRGDDRSLSRNLAFFGVGGTVFIAIVVAVVGALVGASP